MKDNVYNKLTQLKDTLVNDWANRKESMINEVASIKGSVNETKFAHKFLDENLANFFGTRNGAQIFIEGAQGKGKPSQTLFQKKFLGVNPAPDFVVRAPFNLAGEIKYGKVSVQRVANAIGAVLIYLKSSQNEKLENPYEFGCVIFFDTSNPKCWESSKALPYSEDEFIGWLWEELNVFLIIV